MAGPRVTPLHTVEDAAARLSESKWGEAALRGGLASRGVVFLILGYLVARIATGVLGPASESEPASLPGVAEVLAARTGRPVIAVLAVGLALYAVFSAVDAILHHDNESPAAKRWGDRALSAWGFVVSAAFSGYCFHIAFTSSGGTSSAQEQQQKAHWSAEVLRWPAGWFWLGLFALVLLVMAGFLVRRAWCRSFRARLDRDRMSDRTWRTTMVLGTLGCLGRAGLFGVVGGCVLSAAIENDPRHGQGVDGSLRLLADNPAGIAGLWLLAVALVAYAGYLLVEARYRYV
jgi:uncharacterized protein DUF1206